MSGTHRILAPVWIFSFFLSAVFGCSRFWLEDPPNIVLITMDTTRADHCSVHGYERDTTPNLRRLAEQGTRFDSAYSPTSTTASSHATIFTGLYPLTHRVLKNGIRLSDDFATLAERLQGEGYQTAAVVGSFAMAGKFGFAQGFSSYDDRFLRDQSTFEVTQWQGHPVEEGFDRRADSTSRHAIEWLREKWDGQRPFFLFVHFFDPHFPYDPPERFETQLDLQPSEFEDAKQARLHEKIAKYDAEIAFTDFEIGKILDVLREKDLEEHTIVIVTGDHGEGLMDHGYLMHAVHIYEEQVRVPFLIRWPGTIAAGRVIDAPLEMVDLAPTLLGLIDRLPRDAEFPGRNLARVLTDENSIALDPNHPVFLYRQHFLEGMNKWLPVKGEKFGIRKGP